METVVGCSCFVVNIFFLHRYLERFERIPIPFEQLAVERHTNGCTFQSGKPLGDSVRVRGHLFFENCFSCEDLTLENFRLQQYYQPVETLATYQMVVERLIAHLMFTQYGQL